MNSQRSIGRRNKLGESSAFQTCAFVAANSDDADLAKSNFDASAGLKSSRTLGSVTGIHTALLLKRSRRKCCGMSNGRTAYRSEEAVDRAFQAPRLRRRPWRKAARDFSQNSGVLIETSTASGDVSGVFVRLLRCSCPPDERRGYQTRTSIPSPRLPPYDRNLFPQSRGNNSHP